MNTIDFEKYGLHGEEQLVSAAVAGLYAMQVDGLSGLNGAKSSDGADGADSADFPQCDFQSLVSGIDGKQVTINAPAAKEIIKAAMQALDSTLESWNPESPMMVGMKTTLQSVDINVDGIVHNMSTGFAQFLTDLGLMAKEG